MMPAHNTIPPASKKTKCRIKKDRLYFSLLYVFIAQKSLNLNLTGLFFSSSLCLSDKTGLISSDFYNYNIKSSTISQDFSDL